MRRAALAVAIAIGLAIGTAIPTAAIGETQVTLSCDDGTSTTLLVGADTLTGLTQAVQAMIDYPAGLTCTLVKVPGLASFGAIALASPGSNPFIVGGGRWQVPCALISLPITPGLAGSGVVARVPGAWFSLSDLGVGSSSLQAAPEFVWVNIAVNVHSKDSSASSGNPPFFGTLNETIPGNQSCDGNPIGESHFTSKPTCVQIASASEPVYVTSQVTQTSGMPFPADNSGSAVGVMDYVHFGFQDNGNPPGQNPMGTPSTDMLAGPPATIEGTQTQDCNALEFAPTFHLGMFDGSKQYGNISVHP